MSISRFKQELINHFWHFPQAFLAYWRRGRPANRLTTIGVTGTDGKTTTASLIWHILTENNRKAGLITSIRAETGTRQETTGLHVTTPKAAKMQKLLAKMVKNDLEYAVVESTSHGFDQYRLWGSNFSLGIFTNITREHLDYHQTYQHYLQAKARLIHQTPVIILNRDDQAFPQLEKIAHRLERKIITYGRDNNAQVNPAQYPFASQLPGQYNQSNCLAAIAACRQLGLNKTPIAKAVKSFTPPPGRLEKVDSQQDFRIFIDFAHTPNALRSVLTQLKEQYPTGRLITVFGCAGERDPYKRPEMGKIASQLADFIVLTAEDPRREDLTDIMQAIKAGFVGQPDYKVVEDRTEAITFALQEAKPGDTVVICGKGHEQSMCFGTKEYPWSDRKAVTKALKTLNKND